MLGEATLGALGAFLGEVIRVPIQIAALYMKPKPCPAGGAFTLNLDDSADIKHPQTKG
jgi:hypothetical protein